MNATTAHLTAEELAARWKMHPVHIRRTKHQYPYIRFGRKILFPIAGIEEFEQKHQRGVGTSPAAPTALGSVYLVRNKATGLVKIGVAKDPESRIKALQTGAGAELELLGTIECRRHFACESWLHIALHRQRYHREWYKVSDDQIALILEHSALIADAFTDGSHESLKWIDVEIRDLGPIVVGRAGAIRMEAKQ